jgi:hypothetical protein
MKNQHLFYVIFIFFILLFTDTWYISTIASYSGRETAMEYSTWYDLKRDCENILGHSLLNETWLKVKPSNPLPWNETDAMSVLSAVARLRNAREQSKQIVMVRH